MIWIGLLIAVCCGAMINLVQEVLQKQMGLRGELRKAPADVIVVDRAEKVPAAN
jgi:uncharacterized protein (TIGR03435 family)